ncbi:hypothetical protein V498_05322, partial [Pseudogymnoascus sp. VKM F-4517 (FW-2822)]
SCLKSGVESAPEPESTPELGFEALDMMEVAESLEAGDVVGADLPLGVEVVDEDEDVWLV